MKNGNDKVVLATNINSKIDETLLSKVIKEFLEEKIYCN